MAGKPFKTPELQQFEDLSQVEQSRVRVLVATEYPLAVAEATIALRAARVVAGEIVQD